MSNKMNDMKINKLLITMSLPLMLAMFIQALYNIVDSIFVANYSKVALDAVSLTFPVSMIIIAIAVGTSVGVGSLLARTLGANNHHLANNIAMHGLFLSLMNWILLSLFAIFLAKPFINIFSDDPTIVKYALSYIRICCYCSFGVFIQISLEKVMQSTGYTVINLIVQALGAVINIILDPIFIFGLDMGVKGAAYATVIGQIISMLVGIVLVNKKIHLIELKISNFKFDWSIIKGIYNVGLPAIMMQSLLTLMTVGINYILSFTSPTAISVYGIYAKVQQFVFMPAFGLNSAVVAIIGYNYGARNFDRVKDTLKYAVIFVSSIMIFGTILFQLFPTQILSLFNADSEMFGLGIPTLKIISLSFVAAGVNIVSSGMFQAIGRGIDSLVLSLVRQIIMILPLCFILNYFFGVNAMWWGFVISEFTCMIICFFMVYRVNKKVFI